MKTGETLLIPVEECAGHLGVSPRTIVKLVQRGDWIGSRMAGNRYVISRAAFERHYLDGIVAEQEAEPTRSPFLRTVARRAS